MVLVAKGKPFGADRVLAMMFMVSVIMLIAIPVVGRLGGRPRIGIEGTREEVARVRAQEKREAAVQGFMLNFLLVGGITGILVTLASGLVIAYGIGPSWLARMHEGMVVMDTFGDDGQNKWFRRSVPDLPGIRYIVRVRLADGRRREFFTDRETYMKIVAGQRLDARLLGRRLVKIEAITKLPGS